MNIRSGTKSIFLLVLCSCALSASAAETIHGTVRNQTTGKAAAGDEVILLRLQNGMEEEAKTRTDAEGRFVLPLVSAEAPHVVRILHQGVNYDESVSGEAPLEIVVFDAVPRIRDLQADLGIAQVESDGEILKITEMYSIVNEAVPQVTQSGPRNFEISIPPDAALDSVVVKRGGGIWVNVAPVPLKGQQGRYAVDFPIRPGDTLFKFVYHLPYAGSMNLHVKPAYPVRNFAVMHPPSMSFKPSFSHAFTSPGLAQGLRIEKADAKHVVREVPEFEIAGTGLAPVSKVSSSAPSQDASAAHASSNPGAPPPESAPAAAGRSGIEAWALLSGVAALFTALAYAVWKKRKRMVRGLAAKNL
ncbi:MAG TPA: carboxypeptidase-like regulatory domain-containing protein [Candidatus Angelobacter sp.]|nr:carboxypeptidase-like regulatory domain-containing protein [Candidatus Angelobacter sp.]